MVIQHQYIVGPTRMLQVMQIMLRSNDCDLMQLLCTDMLYDGSWKKTFIILPFLMILSNVVTMYNVFKSWGLSSCKTFVTYQLNCSTSVLYFECIPCYVVTTHAAITVIVGLGRALDQRPYCMCAISDYLCAEVLRQIINICDRIWKNVHSSHIRFLPFKDS